MKFSCIWLGKSEVFKLIQPFQIALLCFCVCTEANSSLCTREELLPLCLRKGKQEAGLPRQWWGDKEITLPTTNIQNYHKPLSVFLFCHTLYIQSVTAILLWNLVEAQSLTSSLSRQVFSLKAQNRAVYNINSLSWVPNTAFTNCTYIM